MGHQGRFGKYGEIKRMERLRAGRDRLLHSGWGRDPVQAVGVVPWKQDMETHAVRVRPARLDEGDYIRSLSQEAFRPYGDYEGILSSWFEAKGTMTFLAVKGKKRLGFAMLGVFSEGPLLPQVAELLAIAVEPRSRRRGIGGLLLKEVLHAAKEERVSAVILHTGVDNGAARSLFVRFGFSPVHTKLRFYPKGQDALVMFHEIGEVGGVEPLDADRHPGDPLL